MKRWQDFVDWFVAYLVPTPVWRTYHRLRHPRRSLYVWRKWRSKPAIGEYVLYHDEGPYEVVNAVGDDLVLAGKKGNFTASWMSCCDPVEEQCP